MNMISNFVRIVIFFNWNQFEIKNVVVKYQMNLFESHESPTEISISVTNFLPGFYHVKKKIDLKV